MTENVLGSLARLRALTVRKRRREAHWGDRLFYWILKLLAWSMIFLVLGIVWLLFDMAFPILTEFGSKFFFHDDWNPPMDSFGALPFIYGTLVTSAMAIVIAAPISIGVAVFLTELAPRWLARAVGFLVEMLAAIPSVVYGLWGIFILAPFMQSQLQPLLTRAFGPETLFSSVLSYIIISFVYPLVLIAQLFGLTQMSLGEVSAWSVAISEKLFAGPHYGVGMLTAGIVLAIMITPTISAISREVFSTVNPTIKEAALALGATRWEMIKMAVLKTCRSGMLGAVILGLGRALGETMAVTMVIGNRNEITAALMSPGQTMASVIANEYPEAADLHMAALAAVGLALFAVSLIINTTARLIIWRVEKGARH
jgi:phosphate transport system permease protein